MSAAGVPPPDSEQRWSLAMEALKGVWASKYNDRAYYSLRKVDLNFDDVRMAVLVQVRRAWGKWAGSGEGCRFWARVCGGAARPHE
eukprot:151479-Chlamydomonas_euryale.AAC.2